MSPEDVKQELEQAGRTLMMLPMPRNGRPAEFGTNWPDIIRSRAEWFGNQVFMDAEDRKASAAERNYVRILASSRDIQHLDRMLDWLWLIEDPIWRRITFARSLKYPATDRHVASLRKLARIFDCGREHIRVLHYKGLCRISQQLADVDKTDSMDDIIATLEQLSPPAD